MQFTLTILTTFVSLALASPVPQSGAGGVHADNGGIGGPGGSGGSGGHGILSGGGGAGGGGGLAGGVGSQNSQQSANKDTQGVGNGLLSGLL